MQNDDSPITTSSSSFDESLINSVIFPDESGISYKTLLYEELRLIERNESEINVCWKGAHMMLFFMAFVFGSMCTCCIHRLKFMFGDECVLFPKIVTHSTVHRMVYEFFSFKTEKPDIEPELPVEFVATKWSENSVCYLPTYVPLVSGLSGLVWTTMFLMCSSGTTQNVTGAQRHWRALPIMFLFCAIMAGLCIYTSTITQKGLQDLCSKLAYATGSDKCSYNINVVTLAYDRRIRGVYQATLLSIASAWLHTICWLLSTLLIVARVLLAVDFTLVHVTAHLVGNVEDILQKYEKQINFFNADSAKPYKSDIEEDDSEVELYTTTNTANETQPQGLLPRGSRINELQIPRQYDSELSLVPEMRQRLIENYIRELINNILKNIGKPRPGSTLIPHQEARKSIKLATNSNDTTKKSISEEKDIEIIKRIAKDITKKLNEKLTQEFNALTEKLEHKKTEQDESAGSPKETDKIDKGIPLKRSHTVQFYDDRLSEETKKTDEKNQSEDKDKSRNSRELRILDALNDDDKSAQENNIVTKDQKQDDKKDEENKQYKSDDDDKPRRSSELNIIYDSVPENEKRKTNKDQNQDDKKDEKNEHTIPDDKDKPSRSGELYFLSSKDKRSAPENEKTDEDLKQVDKKDGENEQTKSGDDTVKPRISEDLVSENENTNKGQIQDVKEDKDYEQTKSHDKVKPHGSGELHIVDDSTDNRSDPENEKQTKDQEQKESK